MRYGLKKETVKKIHDVLKKYQQVDQVIIYGSRAKGNYKNGSDIDLDNLFLPYKFDLSIFDHIDNGDLIEHIDRIGLVFYERT